MPLSKLKNNLNKRVAFGKTAAPLYKRDDIDELAIIALESGNKNLINLFEYLPELSVLKKAKTDAQLSKDRSKEDPNAGLKQQNYVEQNKEDPNKDNKKSN